MLLYLHGFASGAGSFKARYFSRRLEALGLELLAPELDEGDFEHLTLSRQLQLVERLCARAERPLVLIGSSLGAYLAALYAARFPVAALVLMAPAIDFARRLRERLGEQAIERWRERGTMQFFHYARGRDMPLGWELFADAARHDPRPMVRAPTLVLHGRRDEIVPLDVIEGWTGGLPRARLEVLDSGHELTEVADLLFERARSFLSGIAEVADAWPALVGQQGAREVREQ
ncbi:MAG: YqiA/YcfP family alpha/beta fold hydrolase [Myxococcales bacterium]|jgi:pimeloyl-ACP methyl ester carboxylesterase